LALALAGCGEVDDGSVEAGIGTFSINLSQSFAGSTKGTVYPDLTSVIDHYKVEYDNNGDNTGEQNFAGDADAITLSLPTGTYTFTVTAYADSGEDIVLATGTLEDVALSAGPNPPAVVMEPKMDEGVTGKFQWDIANPGADVINLIIDKDAAVPITGTLDTTGGGGKPLNPGPHTYVVVGLNDSEPVYHYAGYVYIYPDATGLVSTLVLAAEDFIPGGYGVGQGNGGVSGDITVTLTLNYDVPHVVTLSGTTLSADSDFTDCQWSINGKDTDATGTSFTLPSNILPGKYIVWFTGTKEMETYSDLVPITVAEAP
jgi:hypothetical protein